MFADLWPTLAMDVRGLPCHQSTDYSLCHCRNPPPPNPTRRQPSILISHFLSVFYFSLLLRFTIFFQVNSENLMHAALAHSTEMAPPLSREEVGAGQARGCLLKLAWLLFLLNCRKGSI